MLTALRHQSRYNAELVMRCLVPKMEGTIPHPKTIRPLITVVSHLYGIRKRSRTAFVYRHHTLLLTYMNAINLSTHINPSEALRKNTIRGLLPSISVPSLDQTRAVPVKDTIVEAFVGTGGVKAAWTTGTEQAIRMTMDIIEDVPSTHACHYPTSSHAVEANNCGCCGRSTLHLSSDGEACLCSCDPEETLDNMIFLFSFSEI